MQTGQRLKKQEHVQCPRCAYRGAAISCEGTSRERDLIQFYVIYLMFSVLVCALNMTNSPSLMNYIELLKDNKKIWTIP